MTAHAVKALDLGVGSSGGVAYAPPLVAYVSHAKFSAAGVKTVTVPSGAVSAIFRTTVDFYVCGDATAAVPSVDVDDGNASVLSPSAVNVKGLSSISIAVASAGEVNIAFYS